MNPYAIMEQLISALALIIQTLSVISTPVIWLYTIGAFLLSFIVLSWLWGLLWNKKWTLYTNKGQATLNFILSCLAAYCTLNYQASKQILPWFDFQKTTIAESINNNGSFNRSVFKEVWPDLESLGGQQGLSPIIDGGNELRLNSIEEAYALTKAAAEKAETTLRTRPPFSWGLGYILPEAEEIADSVTSEINTSFPITISPSNEWVKLAVEQQTSEGIRSLLPNIEKRMTELREVSKIVGILCLVLIFITTAIAAFRDIKVNPKVN